MAAFGLGENRCSESSKKLAGVLTPQRSLRGALVLTAGLLALALPSVASAAQRYAGPSGSGTACTAAAPCGFQVAISSAVAGDEVIVLPGDYGSAAAPLPSFPFVLSMAAIDVHGQAGAPRPRIFLGALGLQLSSPGATIRDIELRGTSNGGAAVFVLSGGVAERIVVRASDDIACVLQGPATLLDSVCRAGAATATALSGVEADNLGGATLRNVTAIGAGTGAGLRVFGPAAGTKTVTATNVIARGAGGSADVQAFASPGVTTTVTLDHSNFVTRGAFGGGASVTDPATNGNQTAAPLFANAGAGDYHQLKGSPTIDAGAPAPIGALDFDREPRTLGAAPDIGADEFVDRTPLVTTGAAGAVGATSATLNAAVDPRGLATVARFEYGTTAAYGLHSPNVTFGALTDGQPLTATIRGLSPATTYHFRAAAANSFGSARGGDATFTTAPAAGGAISGRCANRRRGTNQGETLRGSARGDRLLGLGGNDRLLGLAGDDCLEGGRGNDRLDGGAGNDRLLGGKGKDVLRGARGNDNLAGGSGNDNLNGAAGTDKLSGGAGNDRISAADGRKETVSCGAGRDSAAVDRKDRVRGCERTRRR